MKEKNFHIKSKKDKKACSFCLNSLYIALISKKLFSWNVLPIFVGIICFTAIYFGSGIINIKREEKRDRVAYFRQQNLRILPLPEQDPLMTDIGKLRKINKIFDNVTYSCIERTDRMQAGHIIVDNYTKQNPLHIYVGTDVHIDTDKGSINRSVKEIYHYKHDR